MLKLHDRDEYDRRKSKEQEYSCYWHKHDRIGLYQIFGEWECVVQAVALKILMV
jgi:hypothetical protein